MTEPDRRRLDPAARAARMGRRAGESFVATGVPHRPPFPPGRAYAAVRAAWRGAYLAALRAARTTR